MQRHLGDICIHFLLFPLWRAFQNIAAPCHSLPLHQLTVSTGDRYRSFSVHVFQDFSSRLNSAGNPGWLAHYIRITAKGCSSHLQFSSIQFSHSVLSDSLRPHESQHARPSCPSPTPGVYPNSCPLSRWCRPTISSSVVPFSSCPQSFPASGSFQMSQLFASGGQSIEVSASTSVLPMNTQDWSPLGWTGWISLQSKGLSKSFVQHHSPKASILRCSAFFYSSTLTSIHDHWKNRSLD